MPAYLEVRDPTKPEGLLPGQLTMICGAIESSQIVTSGFSTPERDGCWTQVGTADLVFAIKWHQGGDLYFLLEASAFAPGGSLQAQEVRVHVGSRTIVWGEVDRDPRIRAIRINEADICDGFARIMFEFPHRRSPRSLGINEDIRELGIFVRKVGWIPAGDDIMRNAWIEQLGRPVGGEARRTFDQKVLSGFWQRFITGSSVLDIGFRGYKDTIVVPITDSAIGIDIDYPGYDGLTLPFPDGSQDCVYTSHCLEHISDHAQAIRDWHRVTKIGGHIIAIVPHAHLYERGKRPPSQWNADHKRFYTPASLLAEFEEALEPNTYRVRYLEDIDDGYDYELKPNMHPAGLYEICLVLEKIARPSWGLRE